MKPSGGGALRQFLSKEVSKLVSKEEINHKFLLTYLPTNLLTRKRRVAFTLAEVLITLGVIGVVAALTMPTLIQNHQEKVLITQDKVAYSVINQALERVRADNEFWMDAVFNPNNTSLESTEAFAKYFKGAKVLKNQKFYHIKYVKNLKIKIAANTVLPVCRQIGLCFLMGYLFL